ncbi:MAG: Lrp/AsnC family transcriptional regulator [Nitrososphaerota archaeon]|jgi:DNA-binding Lrp family transcriptional regulator|nr:Lrp/AsnC family transcriptional regulator [Nitrososphaerota archaeon]MDG6946722.1 Lrp/AsnC family transcriptional regulator [Nitrososphaerota archaeon]
MVKPTKRSDEAGQKEGALGRSTDTLDLKILRMLLLDGRASARELASSLGVSTSTVTAHLERLRGSGILRGFTAVLDFQRLGYELTVVTEISVLKGKLFEMEREIARLPTVCAVYDVTGEIDAIVVSKCKGREELSRFTKGLLAMPFIERTNSHVVLTTVKEDFRVPI